jgi:thioredoxin-dependent peroxiredoxin
MAQAPAVGDIAPEFELEGTDGPFRLSDQRGRRVVLLFYPGDFTPVCTRQFCSYAEHAEDMSELDAVVVGISAQDLDSHEEFMGAHDIPVPLLADTDKAVARAYGVTAPVLGTRRALVIVDEAGRVAHRDVHAVGLSFKTVDDIAAALDAIGTSTSARG